MRQFRVIFKQCVRILLHSKKPPIVPKKSSPGKVMPQPKYPSSTLQALHSEASDPHILHQFLVSR